MKDRKYLGRFTLQFNMDDPQQMKAAEILEQQGRRKAQFITTAILQYMKHPEGLEQAPAAAGYDLNVLRGLVHKILHEDSQLSTARRECRESDADESEPMPGEWDTLAVPEGVLAAMSSTLAAFQGK